MWTITHKSDSNNKWSKIALKIVSWRVCLNLVRQPNWTVLTTLAIMRSLFIFQYMNRLLSLESLTVNGELESKSKRQVGLNKRGSTTDYLYKLDSLACSITDNLQFVVFPEKFWILNHKYSKPRWTACCWCLARRTIEKERSKGELHNDGQVF